MSLSYINDNGDVTEVAIKSWSGLANGASGTAVELVDKGRRTVQVTGTFGVGGAVVVEGSIDGTNYVTLNDLGGTALSFSAAGLQGVRELTRYIRPRVTAGDATTSLAVSLLASE